MHYSIFMPRFSNITSWGSFVDSLGPISISAYGVPLDINLPSLTQAYSVTLTGTIKRSILYLTSKFNLLNYK